jgi:diguanylate cyclase (GGDEF)-like protein
MGGFESERTFVSVPSERPRGAGKAVLVVISGADLGRQIDLSGDEVDIGRGEEVTFRIDSEQVSRRHASIRKLVGKFVLRDLNSTNGTFVNENKVHTHTLVDGDQIRIGKTVLKYTESALEVEFHEQILRGANVDGLTSAYNKRYFQEALRRSVDGARAAAVALSLVVFDIDHFKQINDGHGHAAGDAVLKQLGDVIRAQLRDGDVFCRIGGEEFAVILTATPEDVARRAAEFIRSAVEIADFVCDRGKVAVTVSLGVAALDGGDADAEALFQRADARLYEAKRGGRNRVG